MSVPVPLLLSVLSIHVVSALTLLCVEAATLQVMTALRASRDPESAGDILRSMRLAVTLTRIAPLLLVLTGLALGWMTGTFKAPWLIVSMMATVLIPTLAHTVEMPRLERLSQALPSAAALAEFQTDKAMVLSARARFATIIWIFLLMLGKPALLPCLAIGAVVYGLILLPALGRKMGVAAAA